MLIACIMLAMSDSGQAQPGQPEVKAGWPGVFPDLGVGWARYFGAPMVGKGDTAKIYQQTAKYEWTGGAAKSLKVTLARDPAFEKKYAAKTLQKEANPPKEVKVGKHAGWLWKTEDGEKDAKFRERLVVPLSKDKVLILETGGSGPWGPGVMGLTEKLDLKKMEEALAKPPQVNPKG
jgi:hypothetical protein